MQNSRSKKSESYYVKPNGAHEDSQMQEFFLSALEDIYWAEKHVTKAIPKMINAATSPELRRVFEEHLEVTKEQVIKLESVFELMTEKPYGKICEAMEGITREAESIIDQTIDGSLTRDVGLIMAAQKIEHYEIATYGTLIRLAIAIGRRDAAAIFSTILEEEKEADKTLTVAAENSINHETTLENHLLRG